ncbi:MAG: nuclear transport factor 2 family protein [Sphingobium sp.]
MHANTIETLLAKQDIQDVMARYARGVDRADGPLLHSCYWDDAIEEHGSSYSGPARPYVDGAVQRLMKTGTICHYVCNMHVELDGDTAWVESYLLTFARFPKGDEPWDTLTGGRIVDKFVRRDGEWRILHRKMAFDWNHDMPSREGWCLGLFKPEDPRMVMGEKGGGDLSYTRF